MRTQSENFYSSYNSGTYEKNCNNKKYKNNNNGIIIEAKVKSETIHCTKRKPPAKRTKEKLNGKTQLGYIFSTKSQEALNGVWQSETDGMKKNTKKKIKDISLAIKRCRSNNLTPHKELKSVEKKNVKNLTSKHKNNYSKSRDFLQDQEKDFDKFGFSKSYLEYIGVRQARWYDQRISKRAKNFMLNIYKNSKYKNIDEVRMKLLFGAFGVRKGIKVRFAL
ncbi:MAG: hypothetical protein JJW01_01395 [Alphaproteobacteria bacterium]|nr:hypothetical protein [Rickettsiales bacterium]